MTVIEQLRFAIDQLAIADHEADYPTRIEALSKALKLTTDAMVAIVGRLEAEPRAQPLGEAELAARTLQWF